MNKQTMFTELSIQIAVLEAKIDKALDLLMKPEIKTPAMTAASIQEFLNSDNENFEDSYK